MDPTKNVIVKRAIQSDSGSSVPPPAIHRLNNDRLSRLLNFCSPSKKLNRLRFVSRAFNQATWTSTSWQNTRTLQFVSTLQSSHLLANTIQLPLEPDASWGSISRAQSNTIISEYERLIGILYNVRVIGYGLIGMDYTNRPVSFLQVDLLHIILDKIEKSSKKQQLCRVEVSLGYWNINWALALFWMPLTRLLIEHEIPVTDVTLAMDSQNPESIHWAQFLLRLPVVKDLELVTVFVAEFLLSDPLFLNSVKGKTVENLTVYLGSADEIEQIAIPVINRLKPNTLKSLKCVAPIEVENISTMFSSVDGGIHKEQLSAVEKLSFRGNISHGLNQFVEQILDKAPKLMRLDFDLVLEPFEIEILLDMEIVNLLLLCWEHTKRVNTHRSIYTVKIKISHDGMYLTEAIALFKIRQPMGIAPSKMITRLKHGGRTAIIKEGGKQLVVSFRT